MGGEPPPPGGVAEGCHLQPQPDEVGGPEESQRPALPLSEDHPNLLSVQDQQGKEPGGAREGIHHNGVAIDTVPGNVHQAFAEQVNKERDGVEQGTGQGEDVSLGGGEVKQHVLGQSRRGTCRWEEEERQLVLFLNTSRACSQHHSSGVLSVDNEI